MAKLTCHIYNNKDIYIHCGLYKAIGNQKYTTKEYHFSIAERNEEDNSWQHISTVSGLVLVDVIADVCAILIEYNEYAESLMRNYQNEHKSKRNKRPIL